MEIFDALFAIGLLLVMAKLLEGLFKRFGISSIFAYAITGVILGPVSGLIDPENDFQILLNIGIFIFFFLVGLDELDISGFLRAIRGRLVRRGGAVGGHFHGGFAGGYHQRYFRRGAWN